MYTSPITLIYQLVQTFQQSPGVQYKLQRKLAYCLSANKWFERVDDFSACLSDWQEQLSEMEFQRLLSTLAHWLSDENNPLQLRRRYVTDEYVWGSIKYTYLHPQLRQMQSWIEQHRVVRSSSFVDLTVLWQLLVSPLRVVPRMTSRPYMMLGLILTQGAQLTRAQVQEGDSLFQPFINGFLQQFGGMLAENLFDSDTHESHESEDLISRVAYLEHEYARLVEDPYDWIMINKNFNNLARNLYIWQKTIFFRSDNLIEQYQTTECVGDECSESNSVLTSQKRQQDGFLSATGNLLYSLISLMYLLAKNTAILAFALFKLMPKLGNLSIAMVRKIIQWINSNYDLIRNILGVFSTLSNKIFGLIKLLINKFEFTAWLSQLVSNFLNKISDLYRELLNKFGMFVDGYRLTKWLRKILSKFSEEIKKQIVDLFDNFKSQLYKQIIEVPHHVQPNPVSIVFKDSDKKYFQQINQVAQEDQVKEDGEVSENNQVAQEDQLREIKKMHKLVSEIYNRVKGRVDEQIDSIEKQITSLKKSQNKNDERIFELEKWKKSEEWEGKRLQYIVESDQALHEWHVSHERTLNLDSFNSLMTFYLVTNRKLSILFQSDLIKEGGIFEESASSKIGLIVKILNEVVGIFPGGSCGMNFITKVVTACMKKRSNKQAYKLYLFILEDPINAVVISRNIAWRLTQRYAAQLGQLYPKDIAKMSGIAVMLIFMILNDEHIHSIDDADHFCETVCAQLSGGLKFSSVFSQCEKWLKDHVRLMSIDPNVRTKISSKRILSATALFHKPAVLRLAQLTSMAEPQLQFFLPSKQLEADSNKNKRECKPEKYGFCFFRKSPSILLNETDEKNGTNISFLEAHAVADLSRKEYYALFLTLFCQPVEIHPQVDLARDMTTNVEVGESGLEGLQREFKEEDGEEIDLQTGLGQQRSLNREAEIESSTCEHQQCQGQINLLMQQLALIELQRDQDMQRLQEEIAQVRNSRSLFSKCIIQ